MTAHSDFGQQPITPVCLLLQLTVFAGQHFPLRQPVPLGQHTMGTPACSGEHACRPWPQSCGFLHVDVAASAQPQAQQLAPQATPVRQSGRHLPSTHPSGQQVSPQICSLGQQVSSAFGPGFAHYLVVEWHRALG